MIIYNNNNNNNVLPHLYFLWVVSGKLAGGLRTHAFFNPSGRQAVVLGQTWNYVFARPDWGLRIWAASEDQILGCRLTA